MAVSKVDVNGQTVVDLTADTVAPENLAEGKTAHDKTGEKITGLMKAGSGSGVGKTTVEGGEIFNTAKGANLNAHAEGVRTYAYGENSHSEGFAPPTEITGTLNVISSTTVDTGKNQHTEFTVTVPKANCVIKTEWDETTQSDIESIIGIKLTDGIFNKHTVFMNNSNIFNVYDFIPQTPIADETQTILIKIVETTEFTVGNLDITILQQGAIGTTSHVEGGKTIASGQSSHAEGFGSRVLYKTNAGDPIGGHAEGTNTIAMGKGSHSEGGDTRAEGKYSHAEGEETQAIGLDSHTEGYLTTASNSYSHAEGYQTIASGRASHTEGYLTIASDRYSHAEGYLTTASNRYSHAEGGHTIALGRASHAEGGNYDTDESLLPDRDDNGVIIEGSLADGICSHAENVQTHALGYASHAEGYLTTASGKTSHAEGHLTTASGKTSHAEGHLTTASGIESHAEGSGTDASGDYGSHAEGLGTDASGLSSHAEGGYSVASNSYSHAEGDNTQAMGKGSHSEGKATIASGFSSHVQGRYNIPDTDDGTETGTTLNKYAHIVGNGNYDTRSNAHTLDWLGNGWYQGDVLCGGENMDDPNAISLKKVAESVNVLTSPNGTKYKLVVDDNGNLTTEKIV